MSATLTRQGEMKGDYSFQGEIGSSFSPRFESRAQPVWSCCIDLSAHSALLFLQLVTLRSSELSAITLAILIGSLQI
jgi:hypothetical protein